MVFDFIDNASMFNMPYSAHRMFNIDKYEPGAYVVASDKHKKQDKDIFRKGEKPAAYLDFPVDPYDYEVIDLFNWQNEAKGMISQHEFVRRVDVQSETVGRYIREGKIMPDLAVPMGNSVFNYFNQETVARYAKEFGWDIIDASNIKDKFMEFVDKMDISYSYKPVLLLAMLENADERGRVRIEDIIDYFIYFYEERKKRGLTAEKKKSFVNDQIIDRKVCKRNIFSNPFKRFEDMRFMEKCSDVEWVQFNYLVWKKLSVEEKISIAKRCEEKLETYYGEK